MLTVHTTTDQLVPVQQEDAYRNAVARAGRSSLLRQAYVARQGHCSFTPAELVAAVKALDHRVSTGRWDGRTTADALQSAALALNLGGAAYVRYQTSPAAFCASPSAPTTALHSAPPDGTRPEHSWSPHLGRPESPHQVRCGLSPSDRTSAATGCMRRNRT
jgi:hypothetical protein